MSFMVVAMHSGFMQDYSTLVEYLSVNGFFRIAVPIFLVINGFYFFNTLAKNDHKNFFTKLLTLYLFWMLFYSYKWLPTPELSYVWVLELVKLFFIGYYHLWYVVAMLAAALILFFIRDTSSIHLTVTAILLYIIGVLCQYLGNYHYFNIILLDEIVNYNWFHRSALFFCLPFFIIGYLINRHSLHKKFSIRSALLLSVLGFIFVFLESYVNFYQDGRDGGFDNYLSLLFVCPLVFIFFLQLKVVGYTKEIALYSTGVYFIHIFVIDLILYFSELRYTVLTAMSFVTSIMLSYFLVKINKKYKFIL